MINWEDHDRDWLREILSQPSGQKLIQFLRASSPKAKAKKIEEVALEAKEKYGWEACIETIEANAIKTQARQKEEQFVDISADQPSR